MMFMKDVIRGAGLGFTVLFIGAVGNGLSTYLLNGKTFQSIIDERMGSSGGLLK